MKNKDLYNQKHKIQLMEDLNNESFNRVTYSFYKYVTIDNLPELRNKLYLDWKELNILGRIYISKEGINAQLNVPEHNIDKFKLQLNKYKFLKDVMLK